MTLFTFNAEDPEALAKLIEQADQRLSERQREFEQVVTNLSNAWEQNFTRLVAVIERLEKLFRGGILFEASFNDEGK